MSPKQLSMLKKAQEIQSIILDEAISNAGEDVISNDPDFGKKGYGMLNPFKLYQKRFDE